MQDLCKSTKIVPLHCKLRVKEQAREKITARTFIYKYRLTEVRKGTDSVLVQSFFSVCSAFRHGNAVFAEQILKQNCLTLNKGVRKLSFLIVHLLETGRSKTSRTKKRLPRRKQSSLICVDKNYLERFIFIQ